MRWAPPACCCWCSRPSTPLNLQAADLLRRQRETALRRSLGASDAHLLALWDAEDSLPLLLSAAAALLVTWWAAPAVANWLRLPPELPVADPVPLAALAGLLATVAAMLPLRRDRLGGPAWNALRRAPAGALQGRTASEGPWGRRARQGLLGVQLGGALLLLALAGVLSLQQRHLLNVDRGFDTHNRLVLGLETDPEKVPNLDRFTAALDRSPAIRHWAFSMERPAADTEASRQLTEGIAGQRQMLRISRVSSGFFDTYGMTILAGHPQFSAAEDNVVIDAKAARLLGFPTPQAAVGALLRGGVCRDARCPSEGGFDQLGGGSQRVTAVVKDVTMESGHDVPRPQTFLITDRPLWNITVTGPDPVALRQALEAAWDAYELQVRRTTFSGPTTSAPPSIARKASSRRWWPRSRCSQWRWPCSARTPWWPTRCAAVAPSWCCIGCTGRATRRSRARWPASSAFR